MNKIESLGHNISKAEQKIRQLNELILTWRIECSVLTTKAVVIPRPVVLPLLYTSTGRYVVAHNNLAYCEHSKSWDEHARDWKHPDSDIPWPKFLMWKDREGVLWPAYEEAKSSNFPSDVEPTTSEATGIFWKQE